MVQQIGQEGWHAIKLTLPPAILDSDVAAFDEIIFHQASAKGRYHMNVCSG